MRERKIKMPDKNTVFTIGRQFGSGGREIGKALADRLSIPFYDGALIEKTAELSGLMQETIRRFDEKLPESRWHPYWFSTFQIATEPMGQQIFSAQIKAIEHIAEAGGAVIVGRCADYILRERKHMISVFIQASEEARIARVQKRHPEVGDNAEDVMKRTDKARDWYYSFYTGKTWGAAESYDLCLRSDVLGVDGTVDMIVAYADLREKIEKNLK